jgi:endogenous inhibitor of DNA gyrase (YacG/DUF329 family)
MRKNHSRRGGSTNTTRDWLPVAMCASRHKRKEKICFFERLNESLRPKQNGPMIHRCPICKRTTDSAKDPDFPFCSERCRLLDLGNWASERYVISEPAVDDSSENPDPHPDEPEH